MKQELVTERVIKDLKGRTKLGLKKYGRKLTTFDGRSSLQDAYEEVLDLAQYLCKKLMEEQAADKALDKAFKKYLPPKTVSPKEAQKRALDKMVAPKKSRRYLNNSR